jgi:HK97 family phage major capsid protein
MSAEFKNVNEAIEKIGGAFEEFKSNMTDRIKAVESKGHVDPLLEEKLNRITEDLAKSDAAKDLLDEQKKSLDELKARTAEMEEKLNRPILTEGGKSIVPAEVLAKRNEFLRTGNDAIRHEVNEQMASLAQGKSLNMTVSEDGAVFWETMKDSAILQLVREQSPIRQIATVKSIGGPAYELRKKTGASTGGWVGEREARAETTSPTFGKQVINVHEIYAEPWATQTMLDDADFDIEADLNEDIAETFAIEEGTAFVTGNGEKKPRGFLTYGVSTSPTSEQMEYIPSGASGAFVASGGHVVFDTVIGTLKDAYHDGAVWVMKRPTLASIMKMMDENKQFVWQPSLQAGTPSTIRGFAVKQADAMPTLAANSLSVAFGNFMKGYYIVDRQGVRLVRDPYTTKPYVKFYTTARMGGDVVRHEAIKVIKFATS